MPQIKHKKKFYMPDAFLNDQEQGELVTMLLSGLDFLSFRMDYDVPMLDPIKGKMKGKGGQVVFDQDSAAVTSPSLAIALVPPPTVHRAVTPPPLPEVDGGGIDLQALIAGPAGDDDLLHTHHTKKAHKKKKKKKKKTADGAGDSGTSPSPPDDMGPSPTPEANGASDLPEAPAPAIYPSVTDAFGLMMDPASPSVPDPEPEPAAPEIVETWADKPKPLPSPEPIVETWADLPKPPPSPEPIVETWADGPQVKRAEAGAGNDSAIVGAGAGLADGRDGRQSPVEDVRAPFDPNMIPGFGVEAPAPDIIRFSNLDRLIVEPTYLSPEEPSPVAPAAPSPEPAALNDVDPGLQSAFEKLVLESRQQGEELTYMIVKTALVAAVGTDAFDTGKAWVQQNMQRVFSREGSAPEVLDGSMPDSNGSIEADVGAGADSEGPASPSPTVSPEPAPASPEPEAPAEPVGHGADVDTEDSNTMLMIKLQVFQHDDEELIKLVRISMVLSNFERPVHLLITNMAVYILTPSENNNEQGYSANIALPFHQIQGLKIINSGNVLRLSARNASGDFVWQFITGDADVSSAVYDAVANAVELAGESLPGPLEAKGRWVQTVTQFVASQEGYVADEDWDYCIGYYEVNAKGFRKEIIHSGTLELKEAGFLSDSWRPQYFQLQGRTLGQLDSRSTRTVKMKLSIDDPSFTCKRVPDAEGRHCLELTTNSINIVVASPSFDDSECWFRALNGVNPCVLGSQDHLSPITKNSQWILVFIIRTEKSVYICRGDFAAFKLKLHLSHAVDTFTTLRAPLAGRGYCQIEFDSEDTGEDESCRVLFKTRASLKRFADKVCKTYKELFQVDLVTKGLM